NEANGGAVMRRTRAKKYIVGAFRPDYEEEIHVTESEIRAIVREELAEVEAERAKLPASDWAKPYIQKAIDNGLMVENGAGSIDRPQGTTTRQELATALNAVYEAVKK
ncbi:MAG: S-layer homology domain-containing protein, partial [Bacillota bacterium]